MVHFPGRTARDKELEREAEQEFVRRRNRFRVLVCLNGSDAAYDALDFAAEIRRHDECDVILLYVRRVDQGLNSGGLQVRVARQNMLDWGLDLPGLTYLKTGLERLIDQARLHDEWEAHSSHTDVFGDPLGDNKIEYRSPKGKSIVLKLKIATDVASGILDQYELGPYNLIITGPPKRWRGEFSSIMEPSTVQKVAMLAPCSVMTKRSSGGKKGFLICLDGSDHGFESMRQGAVLAHFTNQPVTLFTVATDDAEKGAARTIIDEGLAQLADTGLEGVETRIAIGEPVREIIEAGSDYRVIVVADSGKSRLKRFIAGSVAFDVMGQAKTSVLNIR